LSFFDTSRDSTAKKTVKGTTGAAGRPVPSPRLRRALLPPLTLQPLPSQCFLFNELLSAPFSRARRRGKTKKKKGGRTIQRDTYAGRFRPQTRATRLGAFNRDLPPPLSLSLSLSPSFPRARKFDNASGSSPSYVRREDLPVPWCAFRHAAEWMDTRREHARSRVDEM